MKNYRAPRTMAECDFTMGYPTKRPRGEGVHASTWFIVVLGIIGLGLAWWTR